MIVHILKANVYAESHIRMEITVSNRKTVTYATDVHLYSQECNHGTCLEFP